MHPFSCEATIGTATCNGSLRFNDDARVCHKGMKACDHDTHVGRLPFLLTFFVAGIRWRAGTDEPPASEL